MPSATWKVGIADGGLDNGANAGGHSDLAGRKYFGNEFYDDADADDPECLPGQLLCDGTGHGTLVSSIAVGNALTPNGTAPYKDGDQFRWGLGVAPLALAYASHLALLWRRAIWRDRLAWAIAPGRMALTNYLMQTVIALALFHGIGLGLMGKAGPVTWPLIAGVVVAFQAAISWWWLGRFPFGPMEWLWRRATYGRLSPNSRSATHSQS